MKKLIALLLAVMMLVGLVACASTAKTETPAETANTDTPAETTPAETTDDAPAETAKTDYKIGVSIMELTAYTWYQGVIDGCNNWMTDHGAEYGVNFTFDFEDSRSDVQTMLTNVENMIAAGSDGIILFPADASSAIPTMKENVANGIPFVIGDYAQEYSNESDKVWSTFVGHDMKALGVKAGEVAVEYLKTLGKDDPVCLYISVPTSGQVSQDRYDGFAETVLAAFPNAKIIDEGDTGAHNRDSAQTLVENILQRESVIDVVCGHNDAEVVGAYNAAVAQGRDEIKFIGIAGDIDVLNWIQNGKARQNDPPIPKDLAPISSRPRPAQKKKEAFFEELPEVIYSDAVAVISPEPETPAEDAAAQPAADAAKSAGRRRRRGGRRNKPAADRPAAEAAAAPKDAPRAEPQPRRERPKKDRAPQGEKPDAQPRKPAVQQPPRPDKPEGADAQAKRRRRRRGGSRKPAGESQPQKSE